MGWGRGSRSWVKKGEEEMNLTSAKQLKYQPVRRSILAQMNCLFAFGVCFSSCFFFFMMWSCPVRGLTWSGPTCGLAGSPTLRVVFPSPAQHFFLCVFLWWSSRGLVLVF